MKISKFDQPFDLAVVGLGYIGLPTAALFASAGKRVLGVDTNNSVVERVNGGGAHIVEPGIDELVAEVTGTGHLVASTTPSAATTFIIAVPTPLSTTKTPDMSYVWRSIESIAQLLTPDSLIVLESTSPVGTTARVADELRLLRPDLSFGDGGVAVAYCPERVLPGQILDELQSNDRLVGGLSTSCTRRAIDLYLGVVDGQCHFTTCAIAEMAKLTENAFRDVNIALANEVSRIATDLEVDAREVIRLANKHPRVNLLSPGAGVGGHCIAVDPWFLVKASPEARLMELARTINDEQPDRVLDEVLAQLAASNGSSIACLGLAYKPDIDDLRESPALQVVLGLEHATDAQLLVVEPHITRLPDLLSSSRARLATIDEALQADVIVALVAHTAFQDAFTKVAVRNPPLVDPAGLFWTSSSPDADPGH